MKAFKHSRRIFLTLVILAFSMLAGDARPLRLLVIGNSFSANATKYLPDLAKEGGHELILARAQAGSCSLERHWDALAADLADLHDARGKIYKGQSLREIMAGKEWDIITIQQYSLISTDIESYRPFAQKLCDELKKLQPRAEIVVHQTWAYRSDATEFGSGGSGKVGASQREMWGKSRAAYWWLATEQKARIIPTGDAFWRVDSDPQWGYKPDKTFDAKNARSPALPDQNTSLHRGYCWRPEPRLDFDTHHANVAGEYLGALVWYGFLFDEAPESLTFVPQGVAPKFAEHLRKVAWTVVRETKEASAAASRKNSSVR